jgi:hypothetical protein
MMNKNFFGKAVFFFLVSGLFAESYVSRFFRGNIADKNKIVQEASESGDESIAMETLDFAVTAYGAMGDDEELVTLTETAVKSLSGGKEKIVSEKLRKIFKLFNDTRIKIAVLDAFSVFQATENLYLVNDFFYERMQKSAEVDEAILKSILYMGTYGNSASFNMLFIADILDVWPSYSGILSNAYGALASISEKEILQFLSTVPVDKKILVIEKLSSNQKIPKKICGEAAENALSSVIYNVEDSKKELSENQTRLVLVSLGVIGETKWTRASSMATNCFDVLRTAYEANKISGEDFALAVKNIASVATSGTSKVLSSYLDFLNKNFERNKSLDKAVALSVIEALGELGDKDAFDCLLYSTYLDYPEEVTASAKNALQKLKW